MSFAGLLGAGLLGGAGNAAKGIGDRLREEAKQKRAMALQQQIKEDNAAQAVIDQENALLLADHQSENNIKELQAQGLVTKDVNSASAGDRSNLLAQQADIDKAQSLLDASLNQQSTLLSQQGAAAIENARQKLLAQLKLGDNANLADLQQAQTKLEAAINSAAAAQAAIVDQQAAAQKAKTDAEAAAQAAQVAKEAAAQRARDNAEAAKQLAETQQTQLTADNAAAMDRVRAGKVGDVHTFFDPTTGLEYKAVWQENGKFKMEGGTKAPSASKGSIILQSIKLNGKNVTGYMDGKNWVTVGEVDDSDSKPDFTPKDAQAYFTKQAWIHAGVTTDQYGDPKDASEEDAALVSRWVADAMAEWRKGDQKQDPSAIVRSVFYRPYDPSKAQVSAQDIDAAEKRYADEASPMRSDQNQFGGSERSVIARWAKENAVKREQRTIQEAQDAIDKGADFREVVKILVSQGLDSRLVRPKSK